MSTYYSLFDGEEITAEDCYEAPRCPECGELLEEEDCTFTAFDRAGDLRTYGDIEEYCTNPECPMCEDYEEVEE